MYWVKIIILWNEQRMKKYNLQTMLTQWLTYQMQKRNKLTKLFFSKIYNRETGKEEWSSNKKCIKLIFKKQWSNK